MSLEALLILVKFSFAYLFFSPFFALSYKVFFKWGIRRSWWIYTLVIAAYIFLISIFFYEARIGVI